MSKTIELLLDRANPERQERFLGLVPTQENADKVLSRLSGFGSLGIKGFDLAIATYAILRGDESHQEMPQKVDDQLQIYLRPFNFLYREVAIDGQTDHGILDGYTYGLHVLAKNMDDVQLHSYEATDDVAVIAESIVTDRMLLAQRTSDPSHAAFENGYFGCYPVNTEQVISYLVLPQVDTEQILSQAFVA